MENNKPTIKEFKKILRDVLKELDDYDESYTINPWKEPSKSLGDVIVIWKDGGYISLNPDDIAPAHIIE